MCVLEGGKTGMLFQSEKMRSVRIAVLNEKSGICVDIISQVAELLDKHLYRQTRGEN